VTRENRVWLIAEISEIVRRPWVAVGAGPVGTKTGMIHPAVLRGNSVKAVFFKQLNGLSWRHGHQSSRANGA
jgi:hypothetical protein